MDADQHGRAALVVTALAGAAAYGWWLTGLEPFAWPSTTAVSIPAVATIVAAARRKVRPIPVGGWFGQITTTCRRALGASRSSERSRARVAVLWGLAILSFTAVQLFAYFGGWGAKRSDYPTLSWILDHIESRAGRTALFVAWLAFGASLVRR